jgi:hypothetical protein
MTDRIKLEDGEYDRRAVIVAVWSDDMLKYLERVTKPYL